MEKKTPAWMDRPHNPKRAPKSSWCLHDLGDGVSVFVCPRDNHYFFINSEEYWALMEWLEFHGLDQTLIPANEYIYRNERDHHITTTYYCRDDQGNYVLSETKPVEVKTEIHTEQGEAGPLPWPDLLGTPVPVGECRCAT